MAEHSFSYFAWDLLTGTLITQLPLQGVSFASGVNSPGQLQATINLEDPRVLQTNPIGGTIPNRTLIGVDYGGVLVWAGICLTRKWTVQGSSSNTDRTLTIQASEPWAYFQSRVQATDYSAPPTSGIESPMKLWTATPWDASLVACQVIEDAIGFTDSASQPYGDLLGGLEVKLNGATPSASHPASLEEDFVAVNYPFPSMQTVDSIVSQLAQLGLGVGFDYMLDVEYSEGPGSAPAGTVNLSYPRRGRTTAETGLMMDLTTARGYEFPEDGSQTANQVYETGGSGAIVVDENVFPLEQGYPLWERVISRAQIQSQHIIATLGQIGVSDLATFSYAPVTPSVTLGVEDPNLRLGQFMVGDDVRLFLPEQGDNEQVFDARFEQGLDQEWRIVGYKATVADDGDSTVAYELAQPPDLEALSPAI